MAATSYLALSGLNTVGGFLGARSQARGVEDQASYAAQAYTQNASLADQAAADAIARGHEAELRQRTATSGLIGSQRASLAASGVQVDTGSAKDVQADSAYLGELDALMIRNNARREAYGYQVQAVQDRAAAQNALRAGSNEAASIRNNATSSLLTGALQGYQSYTQLRTTSPTRSVPASGSALDSPGYGRTRMRDGYTNRRSL